MKTVVIVHASGTRGVCGGCVAGWTDRSIVGPRCDTARWSGPDGRRRARHPGFAIVAGVLVAACSSAASPRAASSAFTTAAATSTTVDSATQAVLDAYRRYWQVYIAVGSEMSLPDPRLGER